MQVLEAFENFTYYYYYYYYYYLSNNSVDQSPYWEANGHLTTQQILRLLWNPKVY
jgi:hypothetical protein